MGKVGKVMICGMKGVGKTAILEQLIYGNVSPETTIHSTVEDTYIASIDTGRGPRETLRIFDTAGIQSSSQIPKHYLLFPDAYVLVYDPSHPESFDIIASIKSEIDKNKDKKEVVITVLSNMHTSSIQPNDTTNSNSPNKSEKLPAHVETVITKANTWSAKERVRHCVVNAMQRSTLYDPFINLAIKLYPPTNKSTFPLGKLSKVKIDSHS